MYADSEEEMQEWIDLLTWKLVTKKVYRLIYHRIWKVTLPHFL